jgi:hypothetical protein
MEFKFRESVRVIGFFSGKNMREFWFIRKAPENKLLLMDEDGNNFVVPEIMAYKPQWVCKAVIDTYGVRYSIFFKDTLVKSSFKSHKKWVKFLEDKRIRLPGGTNIRPRVVQVYERKERSKSA